MTNPTHKEDHARDQAAAQLESIRELVKAYDKAREANDTEEAECAIHEDALSVEVRSGWKPVGNELARKEYRILLCTGGPAVCIQGDLGEYGEPVTAELFYQDWGTPWTRYPADIEVLLTYARCFYFGE